MKDPKAFWKFLFGICVIVVGLYVFFPAFAQQSAEVTATVHNIGQTPLDDDVHRIKAELPPARYYVQEIRLSYMPDGTVRSLYFDLISQPNADGERVLAQVSRAKGAYEYRIVYRDYKNGIQNGDLDFEDLPKLLNPYVINGLMPDTSFDYVYVDSTPTLTEIDLGGEAEFYSLFTYGHHFGSKPERIFKGTGYPISVTPMKYESDGHSSGTLHRRFLLNVPKW